MSESEEVKGLDVVKEIGLSVDDSPNQAEEKVRARLGIGFDEMLDALSEYVEKNASAISEGIVSIAPSGNYEKLIEDSDKIEDFIKREASKPEHWVVQTVAPGGKDYSLFRFTFACNAVDDGTTFKGFVFVQGDGTIKHAFAQMDD